MGIPLGLRQKLHSRREEDTDPSEPYDYTDLIDLAELLEKNWSKIAAKILTDTSPGIRALERRCQWWTEPLHTKRGRP
jgi:hypothetical protein